MSISKSREGYYRNHPKAELSSTIALREFLWRNDDVNDNVVVRWKFKQHNLNTNKSIWDASDKIISKVSKIF